MGERRAGTESAMSLLVIYNRRLPSLCVEHGDGGGN